VVRTQFSYLVTYYPVTCLLTEIRNKDYLIACNENVG